ncbi:hypothetical protein CJF32_00004706 [Rutstroemia sp. NJR-2017a WRK4]|nr:hypothetical protein CJF32_00004706 [Rutstroemia sp. NJR-2017a WRK4]
MATETVTIEKNYLETLLRRAQFHTTANGNDGISPYRGETITIPKKEHNTLNLRRNLYEGGIAEETLNILINDNQTSTIPPTVEEPDNSSAFMTLNSPLSAQETNGRAYTFGTPRNSNGSLRPRDLNSFQNHGFQHQDLHSHSHTNTNGNDNFSYGPSAGDGFVDSGSGNNESGPRFQRPKYDNVSQRTVQLVNLPEGVTHLDVVEAVRGGMLLDIYLRSHDHTASVSFLEQAHAQEFFRYVKRNDLYIRGRRVDIRWNDRQFILPGHVSKQVATGATRNLVIRHCASRHTEQSIRDDLEHIHNLVVIKVTFKNEDVFISTNSVHNAMFARTCMMSRSTYKGSKIEWDMDECARPLEQRPEPRPEMPVTRKKKDSPVVNRFQVLNMDGAEDDSDAESAEVDGLMPNMVSREGVLV